MYCLLTFLGGPGEVQSGNSNTILDLVFSCPSSSIPTSFIDSFIHYVQFIPNHTNLGAINIVSCIVGTMFGVLKNIVKNIDVDVFSKTSPKHRIVKEKARCFT